MKYRFFSLLAAALLMLAGTACAASLPADLIAIEEGAFEGDAALTGVLTLPEGVTSVGSRAFAGTGLYALVLPMGCGGVEADVLADTQAVYLLLQDAETIVTGDAVTDVPFLFGPAEGSASQLPGFYALETLTIVDGLYYSVTEGEALPLCAVDAAAVSGTLTLPKLVDGQPVLSLATLNLTGCDSLTGLCVSSCTAIPQDLPLPVTTYNAMSISAPVADVTETEAGNSVTWTAEITGAYGDVAYIWTFTTGSAVSSIITAAPTVTFAPTEQGLCIAAVTAIDALDEKASATGAGVTIGPPVPIYRALLVGNVYEGEDNSLIGCDTDVAAMRTMLSSMTGANYSVTSYIDLNASGITSAIASTFAGARACDVSLFYYSGHGTSIGSLVGVKNSTLTVSALRSCLDQIPGTKIVIIDACYSGNMIGKSTDPASPSSFTSAFISGFSSFTKDNLATNGYIVMTACSQNQMSQSLTDGTIAFGAFTYGLCYGSGYDEWNQLPLSTLPADTDGNGAITLSEAYAQAVERVSWLGTLVTLDQSAQYYGDDAFVLWSK